MKFLPYEKITINSKLKPDAAYKVIEDSMTPSANSGNKIFRGKLHENHFKITPWYFLFYNGYLPVLKGEIIPDINGSRVRVTIRPDLIQIGSLMFFLVMILFGLFYEVSIIISSGQITQEAQSQILLFIGLLIFFYIMSMISYKPNIIKYKKLLAEMLGAKEIINHGLFENLD